MYSCFAFLEIKKFDILFGDEKYIFREQFQPLEWCRTAVANSCFTGGDMKVFPLKEKQIQLC